MPMTGKLVVNLHKLARFTNIAIPLLTGLFFLAGLRISFYFHFITVAFIFLTALNAFYRFGQKGHSLLRNFGILGQGRYILESIGPELRQYLFLNDTEERPFNRNERSEVYRKAQDINSASSFGSQKNFDSTEVKVRHALFPIRKKDLKPSNVTFGEERGCPNPYTLKRPFIISAMSFGALGERAVRTFARGAKQAGILMNTGEGGYPKYHLEEGCDLIFQMGTAKFGVRDDEGRLDDQKLRDLVANDSIKMVEIKFSQGAKPGKGGLLPKEKITDEISALRGVRKGEDVVSPPSHAECVDIESAVSFISHVQEVSQLPVGIKLCMGISSEFRGLVSEMKRQNAFPDWITIDGSEGGSGAAPKSFMDRVGIPLFPGLKRANNILTELGVRNRLKIVASGKLVGPGRQMIALCLGADVICSARGYMLAAGCIQAMQCGSNTCPIGITTHDPDLQRGLDIDLKATRIKNYVDNLEHDIEELLCSTGCRSISELSFDHLYVPKDSTLHAYVTKPN
ncbi:MAG: FMN-binding glutamate synthase family protein [Opitutaceae bacterium]|nr:FMN-binding glutamate synthase family protein [Opitutaceae bacterium]